MKDTEIRRVERYLRQTFKLDAVGLRRRTKASDSVEVYVGDEFIGIVVRDEEDGEVSYHFQMAILEMDLPPEA